MQDARIVRERARDLVENNPMARAAVRAYVANVVRCGIMPKPAASIGTEEIRNEWMRWWDLWTERDADVTRVQHFYELQQLWLEEVIVGGGCLVHFRYLTTKQWRGKRRLPLCVELIPEERFCEEGDLTGIGISGKLENGNIFVRGVEIDADTGEHVAYWIKPGLPNDLYADNRKPTRLEAKDCVYGFNRTRIGQNRGFTLLAPVIMWLWKLGYYTDNELMASAMKSCYAVLIKTGDDADYPGIDDGSATVTDLNGNLLEKLEPGIIGRMNHADSVTGVGPNVPPGDSQTWIKLIQRSIAVGMDLSYFGMMRDTTDSNFAGFRAGLNEDRSRYEMWQDRLVFKFAEPTWKRFVPSSVSTLATQPLSPFPSPSEYAADPDAWHEATYRAPGWLSVTPLDDARADEINIGIGVDSRTRVSGRRGEENREIMRELGAEKKAAAEEDIDVGAEPDAALEDSEITSENRR